ncbi:MAG: hypothetical protein WB762_14860 [Candidatus Sulfotelmatobacter sp.]
MKFGKKAEAAEGEQIKSSFLFTIPNKSRDKQGRTLFRDPLGLDIFRKIARQLRTEGFQATEAAPGKACVAAFEIRFPKFDVFAMLLTSRRADTVQCRVSTWCTTALWRRVSPELVSEGWIRACEAIEKILRQDSNVTALTWMTEKDAKSHLRRTREDSIARLHNEQS